MSWPWQTYCCCMLVIYQLIYFFGCIRPQTEKKAYSISYSAINVWVVWKCIYYNFLFRLCSLLSLFLAFSFSACILDHIFNILVIMLAILIPHVFLSFRLLLYGYCIDSPFHAETHTIQLLRVLFFFFWSKKSAICSDTDINPTTITPTHEHSVSVYELNSILLYLLFCGASLWHIPMAIHIWVNVAV